MIDVNDDQLMAALETSHTVVPRVSAYFGEEFIGYVTVRAGDVTFDEGSDIQGRASLSIILPDRVPRNAFNPRDIDVDGWRFFVEYGVKMGTEVRYVPLGTFVCYDLDDSDVTNGILSITGYDTTVLLRDGRFYQPYSIASGVNYATAMSNVVTAIGLRANFPVTPYATPMLLFIEQDDRLEKLREMATSLGQVVIAAIDGTITTMNPAPSQRSDVVLDFVEGQGSKMTSIGRRRTRQGVYNIAVAIGQPAGGAAPVVGIAYDDDPDSKTYYLGRFGQVPVFEKSQFITTQAQANDAARGLLLRKKGIGTALRITTWPRPWMRPGDPVRVLRSRMDVDTVVPVRSLTIPLNPGPGRQMTVQTREGALMAA